jgi:hypothetical protein
LLASLVFKTSTSYGTDVSNVPNYEVGWFTNGESKLRIPIKSLVHVGTAFIEDEHMCRVTRVTDMDFDTLDTVTGDVVIRSLHEWETPRFINSISGVTGLLHMRERTDASKSWSPETAGDKNEAR